MYLYLIEKRVDMKNFEYDLGLLGECLANAGAVHSLIGRLFSVRDIINWRQKYNILYRVINDGSFKLLIKSNIPINKEELKEHNFSLLKEGKVALNKDIAVIRTTLSPVRKENGKRYVLRDELARKAWVQRKLTCDGSCEIQQINELDQVSFNMRHKDAAKGATSLFGYEYEIKVKIKDKDSFLKLVDSGIGPEKAYGFGMLEIC